MKTAPILTGIAVGAAAGATVSMIASHNAKAHPMKQAKKKASHMLRAAGTAMQGISELMH